jgi:electron transfer flavoprotein beta subunit
MKIIVPVKQVIDPYVKVRVKADRSGVETDNVKMAVNPFDEIALEAALQLREAGQASEILAVSIGPESVQPALRTALAMGANRALHIEAPAGIQPLDVARALQQVCEQESPDLVIMGKQAIDDDANQVGQMLAALLSWPQATFASNITLEGQRVVVTREVDAGLERIAMQCPAIITADLRLNEPRYPKLPDIMKAKRLPIESLPSDQLNFAWHTHLKTLEVNTPPERIGGARVANTAELIQKLRDEAKVIT